MTYDERSARFPEIVSVSRIYGATRYMVKVSDAKIGRGYDLCTVDVHDSGLRCTKSAHRSRINPDLASKIVSRYLEECK